MGDEKAVPRAETGSEAPGAGVTREAEAAAAHDAGAHFKDAITLARDVAAIIGIFLFFTGILYRDYYLTTLQGIADSGNVSLPQMAVYAYAVLSDHALWAAAFLVVIAAGSVAAARWPHMLHRFTNARYAVVILGVVAVFVILDVAAQSAARDAVFALRVDSNAIRTRVLFTKEARDKYTHLVDPDSILTSVLNENDIKGLRIVGSSDKGLLVLYQPCVNGEFLDEGQLITIRPGDYVATAAMLKERYLGKPTEPPAARPTLKPGSPAPPANC